MNSDKNDTGSGKSASEFRAAGIGRISHGKIIVDSDGSQCLDTVQLNRLERSFREWLEAAVRTDVRQSRRRILFIFLLIRYTAAKLNEVLALDPYEDIDFERQAVFFSRGGGKDKKANREVHIPESLCQEMQTALRDPRFRDSLGKLFYVDPAFVRRKFYERALECGFAKRLGAPETIRRARAVELMQGNMPLSAVQMLLGHSTPNLTSAYVSFSEEDIREMTRYYLERESGCKTSARNAFFGKITTIRQGDIQSWVELITLGDHRVSAIITNDSLRFLGLKEGGFATAEIKAPWITMQKGTEKPLSSAENIFQGVITNIRWGEIGSEYVIRLDDGNELCAIVSSVEAKKLGLRGQDRVWAFFNSYSVVLHLD